MTNDPTLTVLFGDEPVADLRSSATGMLELLYRPEIVARLDGRILLSVSLPVRRDAYSDERARPFLDGLLPEGLPRQQLFRRFRIEPSDVFGLLREIGRDCAGAISFLPAGELGEPAESKVEWLSEVDVTTLLEELPLRPLGADPEHGIRMSLAGSQNKLPVVLDDDGRIGLPQGHTPSSHIIKPISAERTGSGKPAYPGLVENEAFCLRLAANAGLPAADVAVRRIGDQRVLVVRRYDRRVAGPRGLVRLHQEDACQALGVPPGRKYEEQGGPGIVKILDLIRRVSVQAGEDILSFLDRTAFNVAVANLDAHGKNTALLYDGGIHLAPMYDVISTAVYPRLSGNLAMSIGGQYQADQVTPRHWWTLLEEAGLNTANARRRLADLADRTIAAIEPTRAAARTQDFDHEVLDQIEQEIRRRVEPLVELRSFRPRA